MYLPQRIRKFKWIPSKRGALLILVCDNADVISYGVNGWENSEVAGAVNFRDLSSYFTVVLLARSCVALKVVTMCEATLLGVIGEFPLNLR